MLRERLNAPPSAVSDHRRWLLICLMSWTIAVLSSAVLMFPHTATHWSGSLTTLKAAAKAHAFHHLRLGSAPAEQHQHQQPPPPPPGATVDETKSDRTDEAAGEEAEVGGDAAMIPQIAPIDMSVRGGNNTDPNPYRRDFEVLKAALAGRFASPDDKNERKAPFPLYGIASAVGRPMPHLPLRKDDDPCRSRIAGPPPLRGLAFPLTISKQDPKGKWKEACAIAVGLDNRPSCLHGALRLRYRAKRYFPGWKPVNVPQSIFTDWSREWGGTDPHRTLSSSDQVSAPL